MILVLGAYLGLSLLALPLAAADGDASSTTITTSTGSSLTTAPGKSTVIRIDGAGTVIATTTNDAGTDPEVTLAPGLSIEPTAKTDATPSRWSFDEFTGVRFGGIIGASFDNTLTYDCHGAVMPELSADIGVGGVNLGLGARWSLSKKQWTLSSNGVSLDYASNTAIVLRAISPYRWETRHRRPSLWHGIVTDGGWYYGGEVDLLVDNFAFAAQATWETHDRGHGPHFTLAYGFGF